MTRDQLLLEIRKELGVNERLARLLKEFGEAFSNVALRKTYTTNDAAILIRQAGMAEGVEKFVSDITKAPAERSPGPSGSFAQPKD